MDDLFDTYFEKMECNSPALENDIKHVEEIMGISFPRDYVAFMMKADGAEGSLGENSYLSIWRIEDIAELNNDYEVSEYTPGLVYFGSDGGGIAYAFDMNLGGCIVEFPFDSIHYEDAKVIGHSFIEFIRCLFNR